MKPLLIFLASLASLHASPYGISNTSEKISGTQVFGILQQPAPPQVDAAWTDFVTTSTQGKSITHWEVLDSFNLGPRQQNTPFRYTELLTLAHKAAPQARIGFSLANYDLQFLDAALRDGAVGQFHYISLCPFPCSEGCSPALATVLPTIRKLLKEHGADPEMPIHITLSGNEAALIEAAPIALSLGFSQIFLKAEPTTLSKIPTEPATISTPPDFSGKESVRVTLGEIIKSEGLYQLFPTDTPWDAKLKANRLPLTAKQPLFRTTFLAASGFIPPDDSEIQITVIAKRIPVSDLAQFPTAINLTYESTFGTTTSPVWWSIPEEDKWHTQTWTIKDAKFTGKLGWNFLLDASGAGNDVLIREVILKK